MEMGGVHGFYSEDCGEPQRDFITEMRCLQGVFQVSSVQVFVVAIGTYCPLRGHPGASDTTGSSADCTDMLGYGSITYITYGVTHRYIPYRYRCRPGRIELRQNNNPENSVSTLGKGRISKWVRLPEKHDCPCFWLVPGDLRNWHVVVLLPG
jgi:hypothetical protein